MSVIGAYWFGAIAGMVGTFFALCFFALWIINKKRETQEEADQE